MYIACVIPREQGSNHLTPEVSSLLRRDALHQMHLDAGWIEEVAGIGLDGVNEVGGGLLYLPCNTCFGISDRTRAQTHGNRRCPDQAMASHHWIYRVATVSPAEGRSR